MLNYYREYLNETIMENPFVKDLFCKENSKLILENAANDI